MPLSIKNPEAERLAHELASLTGESVTRAVTESLRERRDRLRDAGTLAERLLAIGRDCAARLPEHVRTVDHAALLYDDEGLPR